MKKIKEKIIEINKDGGKESQSTHHTNKIKINEVIIRGNLEVNILALILNRKDDASIFLEIYNLEIKDCEKNIRFNFNYNEIDNYSFNKDLKESIIQTVNNLKTK